MNETATVSVLQPQAAAATIDDVFRRQQAFAPSLRGTTAKQRIAKLMKLKQAMESRREQIHEACAADFGKPPEEVDIAEIFPVLHEIAHAKRHLRKWMQPVKAKATMSMLGTAAEIRYEPKGVTLIISPWNYPVNLSLGPLVSAIAAGNTAIIKPSEMTPNASRLIRQIVEDLFEPEEVAVFEGDASVAQKLLSLPFNHIFFTGSPAIGKMVMRAASEHLASVTLELGGKSPTIVDETADLDKSVRSIVYGKFVNKGQTCIAPDYVYVHESVRDAFLEKIRKRIDEVYGASEDAQRKAPHYARMVNERHFERVRGLLDDARKRGAKVVVGGWSNPEERYIAPTVLADVPLDSKVMEEEIFGPLLPVLSYRDLDATLREIDARPKPLALYIYSKSKANIERVLANSTAGGTGVNCCAAHFLHGNLPFGGINNSGIGNAHGIWGFKAFSHERAVLTDKFSSMHKLAPPYTDQARKLIRLTMKYFA